ncbi:MAG: hypothetical protein KGM99_14680, partial [Burkholderiales bacterium]|nr:hypothetical protein [Burkholderiales bacterium]
RSKNATKKSAWLHSNDINRFHSLAISDSARENVFVARFLQWLVNLSSKKTTIRHPLESALQMQVHSMDATKRQLATFNAL